MKKVLLLNAVNPRLGGVFIRGEKGTAKTTAVRALAALLPEIPVVPGCPYQCNPFEPRKLCPSCHLRYAAGESLPVVWRRVQVVDLPVSATEDRVVGSLGVLTVFRMAALASGASRGGMISQLKGLRLVLLFCGLTMFLGGVLLVLIKRGALQK